MAEGTKTALLWPHYEVIELRTIQEVKHIFGPDGVNVDQLNWCFIGTAGPHGTYTTLDELELIFAGEHPDIEVGRDGKAYVSVLVLHPRLVVMKYGEIPVTKNDVPYLRTLVNKTLECIAASQEGNR